jgi:hypothetical protein
MEEKSSLIPLFLRGNQTSPFLAEKGEFKRGAAPLRKPLLPLPWERVRVRVKNKKINHY